MDKYENVYRTKKYIVKQILKIQYNEQLDTVLCSQDTYYLRTKARDRKFEKIYSNKHNINGRRIHSTMYSRKYID